MRNEINRASRLGWKRRGTQAATTGDPITLWEQVNKKTLQLARID